MKVLLYLPFFLLLASCASSTQKGAVGVERQQLLIMSSAEVHKSADTAYTEILAEAKKNKTLNTDKKMLERIQSIADRLIPQTAVFRKDAPQWHWMVNLIKSDQLNAWCMPGGKIAFYTGIIEKLQLTDAEIAAIMGHEMAHALREHGRERISEQMLTTSGLNVLSSLFGVSAPAAKLVTDVTLTLPNSRTHETEADRIGIELIARANFNPYAAVKVWEKMEKVSSGSQPEILSTHPSNKTRIQDLKKYAKLVKPLYEKNKSN